MKEEIGEEQQWFRKGRRDVCPEAASEEETVRTDIYDSWIHRLVDSLRYHTERYANDNTEMDGVPEAAVRMVDGTYKDSTSRWVWSKCWPETGKRPEHTVVHPRNAERFVRTRYSVNYCTPATDRDSGWREQMTKSN